MIGVLLRSGSTAVAIALTWAYDSYAPLCVLVFLQWFWIEWGISYTGRVATAVNWLTREMRGVDPSGVVSDREARLRFDKVKEIIDGQ